jgi:hypothetical protein
MAFEVPLEADRVDDLNFFSTVWRAPVIGAIFWILGGDKALRKEEEEEVEEKEDLHRFVVVDSSVDAGVDLGRQQRPVAADDSMKRSFSKRSALKKNTPSLADSEVSALADVGESFEGLSLSSSPKPCHRKKELSWSDESGKDLAEVIHEVSYSVCTSLLLLAVARTFFRRAAYYMVLRCGHCCQSSFLYTFRRCHAVVLRLYGHGWVLLPHLSAFADSSIRGQALGGAMACSDLRDRQQPSPEFGLGGPAGADVT